MAGQILHSVQGNRLMTHWQ